MNGVQSWDFGSLKNGEKALIEVFRPKSEIFLGGPGCSVTDLYTIEK